MVLYTYLLDGGRANLYMIAGVNNPPKELHMRILIAGLVLVAVAMTPLTICTLIGHAASATTAVVYLPTVAPVACFGNAMSWGI